MIDKELNIKKFEKQTKYLEYILSKEFGFINDTRKLSC